MDSPFSPFVRRLKFKDVKRRQSELPSDLIDWEAPEIPELEKQQIIYEELMKEMREEHTIETLINEEIITIAAETLIMETKQAAEALVAETKQSAEALVAETKQAADAFVTETKQATETLITETKETYDKLLKESNEAKEKLEASVKELESKVEILHNRYKELEDQYKIIEFHNQELDSELSCQLETFLSKKSEAEDLKRKWENARNQLNYYKKLAKGEVK